MENQSNEETLVKKMAELYVTYRKRYILCLPSGSIITPKKKNGYHSTQTDPILRNHLRRKYAVGIFAGAWGSKFVCFDVDDGSKDTVRAIMDELIEIGIPRDRIYASYSGGKGYHVEVFFEGIVSTERLHALYKYVIQKRDLDPRKVEFRPTHTSAIKLPLSAHAKTEKICWYVDRGNLMPIERMDYVMEIQPISLGEIDAAQEQCVYPVIVVEKKGVCEAENVAKASEDKVHGVTIQHAGTRHNVMRNITVYLRVHGCSAADCRDELKRWITTQDTSLYGSSPEEIDKDIEELIRWAYSDSFVIKQSSAPNQATVYMCQMEEILKRESRSERRLLFLLSMRGQMLQPRISTKDAAKVTGISQTTVKKMLRRMLDAHVISCSPSMKFCLQDGTFSATSRGYTVALPAGNHDELHLQLTMKEQMFDFDRSYYCALHTLIPQFQLKRVLSKDEWQEYLNYLRSVNGEEGSSDEERRIDLQGTSHTLVHPKFGTVTVYEVEGRMLYPAYDCAKLLGRQNPSVLGSQCRHKERWQVKMQRCRLADGTPSYQIMDKNFIPAEDVKKLARSSQRPEATEVCDWILSLENTKKE